MLFRRVKCCVQKAHIFMKQDIAPSSRKTTPPENTGGVYLCDMLFLNTYSAAFQRPCRLQYA